jgi:hypothetical protein
LAVRRRLSRRPRFLLLLLPALILTSALARAESFEGIIPGESTLGEVATRYGQPARSRKVAGGRQVFYEGMAALRGYKRVQLEVNAGEVITQLYVTPEAPPTLKSLIKTYGGPCSGDEDRTESPQLAAQRTENQACYVRGGTRARPALSYRLRGLTLFLSADQKKVSQLLYSQSRLTTPVSPEAPAESDAEAPHPEPAKSTSTAEKPEEAPQPVSEPTPITEDEPAPLPTGPEVKFAGRVRARGYETFAQQVSKITSRREIEASLRADASLGKSAAFVSLLVRHDFADATRDRFDPAEAFIEYKGDWLSFGAGRRLVRWGEAGLYQVSDILNPIDFRDPLSIEKLATWMVQGAVSNGPFRVELVYLPVPERTLLAPAQVTPSGVLASESPWAPPDLPPSLGGPRVTYMMGNVDSAQPALREPQVAERVSYDDGKSRFSVGHLFIFDRLPSVRLVSTGPSDARVDFAFRRLHAFTLAGAHQFETVHVAAETIVYAMGDHHPEDVEDTFFSLVASADWISPPFFAGQRIHLFADYSDTYALRGQLVPSTISLRYPWQKTFFFLALYHFSPALTFSVFSIKPLLNSDVLVSPAVECAFTPMIGGKLSFSILGGDPSGLLGRYKNNSRVEISLEARF